MVTRQLSDKPDNHQHRLHCRKHQTTTTSRQWNQNHLMFNLWLKNNILLWPGLACPGPPVQQKKPKWFPSFNRGFYRSECDIHAARLPCLLLGTFWTKIGPERKTRIDKPLSCDSPPVSSRSSSVLSIYFAQLDKILCNLIRIDFQIPKLRSFN